MKLAVCLISCGRHDLTRQTVETFMHHNVAHSSPWVLLQADEPSMGPQSAQIGAEHGFLQVHAPVTRSGQMTALRALVGAAAALECTHVLWLENDWASCAPLPWGLLLDSAFPTVRLFGEWKRLDHHHPRARAGELLLGTTQRVRWRRSDFVDWQEGSTHWAAGGSIIELALLKGVSALARLKDAQMAMGALHTARPTFNILHSIGDETTAGFMH